MENKTSMKQPPLFSSHGHLLAIPTRVLPFLSPLLSGHQALSWYTKFGFILRNVMKENTFWDRRWRPIVDQYVSTVVLF